MTFDGVLVRPSVIQMNTNSQPPLKKSLASCTLDVTIGAASSRFA